MQVFCQLNIHHTKPPSHSFAYSLSLFPNLSWSQSPVSRSVLILGSCLQICPGLKGPLSRSVLVSRALFQDLSWSRESCFKICPALQSPVSKSVLVSRVLFQDLSRSLESCFKICPGLRFVYSSSWLLLPIATSCVFFMMEKKVEVFSRVKLLSLANCSV